MPVLWRHAVCAWLVLLPPVLQAAVDDLVARQNQQIPRLVCDSEQPSRDETLAFSLVEKRVQDGQLHAAYADVLALPAHQARAALLRADILRRLGRPEARRWYEALLRTCLAAQARHGLGQMSAAKGDWLDAVSEFQKAVMLTSTEARFRNDLGYALLQAGSLEAAEFELKVASELDTDSRLPFMNLLLLAMVRGDSTRAEQLIVRWQPSRREFDDLLGECARLKAQQPGGAAGCPLRF